MNKHQGCERKFVRDSKAWYASTSLPDDEYFEVVTIGFYSPEGGTTGEFCVKWMDLMGNLTPRLYAFDDGWNALYNFMDMLKMMSELGDCVAPEDFCKKLESLGIEDATPINRAE